MVRCRQCGTVMGESTRYCPACGYDHAQQPYVEQPQMQSAVAAQSYKKGPMIAANIINAILLAIFYYLCNSGLMSMGLYNSYYWGHKALLAIFLSIIFILAIIGFVFSILSKHKLTLFVGIFSFTIGMFPLFSVFLALIVDLF